MWWNYVNLRCTKCWTDILLYCNVITTKGVANSSIRSQTYRVCVCVCVVNIYSLSNYQPYNTLLTISTVLNILSPHVIYLPTGSLYPLTDISPFPHPILLSELSTFCSSHHLLGTWEQWISQIQCIYKILWYFTKCTQGM